VTRVNAIESFARKRVLVIGDTIVDIYVYGTAIGKSAETPTIVAREGETKYNLGGAFLVVRNLLELGAAVDFVTLVGGDEQSALVRSFSHPRCTVTAMADPSRRTTVKKRFWVDGYKLLQFDTLDNREIDEEMGARTLAEIDARLGSCDAVIVSDYRHGFLPPALAAEIVARCRAAKRPLFVDSQLSQRAANHADYRGADVFVVNAAEARAVDSAVNPDTEDAASLRALAATLDARALVVKRGELGARAVVGERECRSPAARVTPVDTCGAGDAFLAALSLAGLEDLDGALRIANTWAGLSTQVHGTEPAKRSALIEALGA
jgi:D-beta-D-heptose 7-phosphate kinase/D-beta-D-heptose 1-phosphate adenosyltransferase